MTKEALIKILNELALLRPVFHSEADFQHELGCILKSKGHSVRLERPYYLDLPNFQGHSKFELDIEIDGHVAIELKYKTKACNIVIQGEGFNLRNHAASNLGRFDVIDDARRIRNLINYGKHKSGFVVFLTNSNGYWENDAAATMAAEFNLMEGRLFEYGQTVNWVGNPNANSVRPKRLAPFAPIEILFNEKLRWCDYSFQDEKSVKFRFLFIDVNH
jgi:hypothetical protein